MAGIALDEAQLVGIFLETLFFGMFFVMYCITLWILVSKRTAEKTNKVMILTVSLMFILAIVHVSIDLSRILDAFIGEQNVPEGALLYYANLSNPKQVSKTAIYATQTIIGDSFVTYRTFLVWQRNYWVVILPSLLIIGNAVTGYGTSYELALQKPGANIFLSTLQPWITSYFILTFCTNVICTTLIAGRLWWRERKIGVHAQVSLWPVVTVVVESGAIYSGALIALLVVYLSGSNGQYPALDLVNPLIGVTFSLILVRVGLGISSNGQRSHSGNNFHSSSAQSPAVQYPPVQYPLKPLSINVSRLVERDGAESDEDRTSPANSYLRDFKAV